MTKELKVVEDSGMIKVYENEKGEKVVSGRELHELLEVSTLYKDWFPRMCEYGFTENVDFVLVAQKRATNNPKNPMIEFQDHHCKLEMGKEIGMIQRTEKGKQLRQYFIECERRYKHITEQPKSFDMLRAMIDKMEENERMAVEAKATANTAISKVEALEHKLDIKIGKDYVKANNIATLLGLSSESGKPHAQLIGAIAKTLGMKIGFRNYFEDNNIAIVKQDEQWEIYYKPVAVEKIENWFKENKEDIYFEITYAIGRKKGQTKERGYKVNGNNFLIK